MIDDLRAARRADSVAKADRVRVVIQELQHRADVEFTINTVARYARVHRSFLHRHSELKAAFEAARSGRLASLSAGLRATEALTTLSLRAELENERAASKRLREDLRRARQRVGELTGNQIASELGAGDIDWQQRATELQKESRELEARRQELEEEIEAVRLRNRELTRQLNLAGETNRPT